MTRRDIHDIDTLSAILRKDESLSGHVLQGLDLSGYEDRLERLAVRGVVFLGCKMSLKMGTALMEAGAAVFPDITGVPYSPYRPTLYTPEELFEGFDRAQAKSYANTLDARIYQHVLARGGSEPQDILESLAQRLHDFSITDARKGFMKGRDPSRSVAIMGGHDVARGGQTYKEIAALGAKLTQSDYLLLTGGGPGAMEAAHFGAAFARMPHHITDAALKKLSRAPDFRHEAWLTTAFEARAMLSGDLPETLAIPTWVYGHEPPTLFAKNIAKYFSNSTREEGLISLAIGGIIFAPGNAGTIQEIFQDFAQNHYLTTGYYSPMIFLGRDYWTKTRPVFPLLQAYAKSEPYEDMLHLVDSAAQAMEALCRTPPRKG